MSYSLTINQKRLIEGIILTLISIGLYFIGKQDYNIFHIFSEVITIVFGLTLMLIGFATINVSKNNYFHILAIIFGFVGFIDLFHVLAYASKNTLSIDYNISVQFSILAGFYECFILNLSVKYINKKYNFYKLFIVNAVLVSLLISSIIIFNIFPDCYTEGQGSTIFRQVSEFIFVFCFITYLVRITKSKANIFTDNKYNLIISIIFEMLSRLALISSTHYEGIFSLLGSLFKIISFYFCFRVVFRCIVLDPYAVLFVKLNNKIDELESVNKKLRKAKFKAQSIEKLHEKYINLIPDGILIVRDKKIESANKRFLNMFGIEDEKKLINMKFTEILDNSYLDIFSMRINNADRSILEVPQQYEFIWENKRKWVEVTSLIDTDDMGEYIISTIRNIEDRRKAEEAEQLLELKEKEEKMKNEFFTNISHELRTPINVIYSALQLQNDYFKTEIQKDAIIKYNKIIRQNCLRLIRLINNLIDITRIEANFFKPNFKIENIVSVVEDITMSIVEYVKSKKIKLVFDTEIEEVYVNCDSNLIEKIILNLLSNAVKYGKEDGSIEVYICQKDQDTVSISVKDDGIGIPKDMKEKIFDRFLRVDTTLSRNTEGSGIGLALVKQLVEIHEGKITLESELDRGTEFKIALPIVNEFSEGYDIIEKAINYNKNIVESAEIEFSDIYY